MKNLNNKNINNGIITEVSDTDLINKGIIQIIDILQDRDSLFNAILHTPLIVLNRIKTVVGTNNLNAKIVRNYIRDKVRDMFMLHSLNIRDNIIDNIYHLLINNNSNIESQRNNILYHIMTSENLDANNIVLIPTLISHLFSIPIDIYLYNSILNRFSNDPIKIRSLNYNDKFIYAVPLICTDNFSYSVGIYHQSLPISIFKNHFNPIPEIDIFFINSINDPVKECKLLEYKIKQSSYSLSKERDKNNRRLYKENISNLMDIYINKASTIDSQRYQYDMSIMQSISDTLTKYTSFKESINMNAIKYSNNTPISIDNSLSINRDSRVINTGKNKREGDVASNAKRLKF